MRRYILALLPLTLTALFAWGCSNSRSNSPASLSTDDTSDDTDAPAFSPLDDSISPRGGEITGADPQLVRNQRQAGPPAITNGTGHGRTPVVRNCDGDIARVPANPDFDLFTFNRGSNVPTNLSTPWNVDFYGTPAVVTWGESGWTATERTFVITINGDVEIDREVFPYSTALSGSFTQDPTCLSLTSLAITHAGGQGNIDETLVFGVPLIVTSNRFLPMVGETHTANVVDPVGGSTEQSSWTAVIEQVVGPSPLDLTFITFTLTGTISGAEVSFPFMWTDADGIVAFTDPFFPDKNTPLEIHYEGHPF